MNELRGKIYKIANKYEHNTAINDDDSLKINRLIVKYYPNFNNNEKIKDVFQFVVNIYGNGFTL